MWKCGVLKCENHVCAADCGATLPSAGGALHIHQDVGDAWGETFTLITPPRTCTNVPPLNPVTLVPHTSQVPPLRVRPGDVRDYSRHILAGIKNGSGTRPRDLSLDAAKRLESYTWPGNVTVRGGYNLQWGPPPGPELRCRQAPGDLHLAWKCNVEGELDRGAPAWGYI